jgi:hypothetical protein
MSDTIAVHEHEVLKGVDGGLDLGYHHRVASGLSQLQQPHPVH